MAPHTLPAVLLTLLLASMARAELDDAAVMELELRMRKADAARVTELLGEEDLAANLAREPAVLRQVCSTAAKHAGAMAARGLEQTVAVADALIALSSTAVEAKPADADGHWALAKAHVTRGAARRFADEQAPAEDWLAAVGALQRAYRSSGDASEALTAALTYVAQGGFTTREERLAVLGHMRWIGAAVVSDQTKAKDLTLSASSLALEFARKALPQKQKDAKAFLQVALDCLRPFVERAEPDEDAGTLHEAAITFRYEHGFVLPDKYVTRTAHALDENLTFEIPVSRRWKLLPKAGELSERVIRLDAAGQEIRRVRFRRYAFEEDYVFPDGGEVSGDNAKGLSRLAVATISAQFARVDSVGKTRKGRLTATITGYLTEITGLGGDGEPQVARLFTFRGKKLRTFVLVLLDRAPDVPLDPSMLAFLDTVREP